ncbi:hypothetical protein H7I76_26830 [Mycolicibacterium vaccae]|nr:hypothetical protein [Mycolicibacterium vaccae]
MDRQHERPQRRRQERRAGPRAHEEVRDAYIKAVHEFRDLLNEQLKKVEGLPGYDSHGTLESAAQTKRNLDSGCNELKRVIKEYTEYLDAFADTVTAAGKRLIESG